MLDFFNACLSATVAGRAGRIKASLGCGREAVTRLGIALALIAALAGALDWSASGMEPDTQVAQVREAR